MAKVNYDSLDYQKMRTFWFLPCAFQGIFQKFEIWFCIFRDLKLYCMQFSNLETGILVVAFIFYCKTVKSNRKQRFEKN